VEHLSDVRCRYVPTYAEEVFVVATVTAREFNQDASAAKRAADAEPVIITDRGVPSHVLISYQEYVDRLGEEPSVFQRLSVDDGIDFEPQSVTLGLQVPEL
jgi:prevent-host-death family protein